MSVYERENRNVLMLCLKIASDGAAVTWTIEADLVQRRARATDEHTPYDQARQPGVADDVVPSH